MDRRYYLLNWTMKRHRGFEQVTKTQDGGSHNGYNNLIFRAQILHISFYGRFLVPEDPRRLQRPKTVPNYLLLFNLRHETGVKPSFLKYNEYIVFGVQFNEREDHRILAIDGFKGVWLSMYYIMRTTLL